MKDFGVIVLAAGLSERMGTLKPLLKLGEKTLLEHVLSNPFLQRPTVRPIVVLGHGAKVIRDRIKLSFPWIVNPHYKEGRTASVQCGLCNVSNLVQGAFIWPVDCPLISSFVFERLVDCFKEPTDVCIPSYRRRRGHPPLIGRAYFSEILEMTGDLSLRDIYVRHPSSIRHVNVDEEGVLYNLNTPEEYRAVCERFENKKT